MQIRADVQGTLGYIAQPAGKPPTVFALLRMTDAETVFENLAHDFPQRVAYRLDDATNVTARIEGMRNGSPRVIEFPLSRTGCDSAPR